MIYAALTMQGKCLFMSISQDLSLESGLLDSPGTFIVATLDSSNF